MDRSHLAAMLEHEGEAFVACRQAVLSGARFRIDGEAQPASILFSIYTRRKRHTREHAVPTLGFTEAVNALGGCGDEPVRIGAVETAAPPYHFQLFLNQDATEVIACLGVAQGPDARQHLP